MTYRFLSLLPVPVSCIAAGLAGYDFNNTAAGGLLTLECVAAGLVVHGLFFGIREADKAIMTILDSLNSRLDSVQNDVRNLKTDAVEQIEARKKFAEKYLPGDPWSQGQ